MVLPNCTELVKNIHLNVIYLWYLKKNSFYIYTHIKNKTSHISFA